MMTDADKLMTILKAVESVAARMDNRERNLEYNPADNGNFDDAYSEGYDDAEIHMARDILRIIRGE